MSSEFHFAHNLELLKYPSTLHLEGSKLPPGDRDCSQVPYAAIAGRYIVAEEKLDAANSGISFSAGGELLQQSRGHYLTGGGRERQFNLFKKWGSAHEDALLRLLEDRYVMYGEWMHKKHSIFYDRLPHYFNEFDIFDRRRGVFLSTAARCELLQHTPVISVPVLYAGPAPTRMRDLIALVRPSLAKSSAWRTRFEAIVTREGFALEKCWQQTDKSDLAEGLYIKVEEDGRVVGRYKWVQPGFVQTIEEAGTHHLRQPYIPNQLAAGVDIYAAQPLVNWQDLGLVTLLG